MNSAKISEKIAHLAKQFNVRTPTVCLHCKVVSTHVIFSSIMIIIFDTRKEAIIDKVMTDDVVLHLWSLCVPDAEQNISYNLLKKIVELYVKIRGFAFASSCVELYKQANKKPYPRRKHYEVNSIHPVHSSARLKIIQ